MIRKISKIILVVAAGIFLVACGEKYVEPADSSFSGTRVYESTKLYNPDTTIVSSDVFIVMRDNLMLYYTKGVYDSSFQYRDVKSKIYGTRTKDIVRFASDVKKIKVDSDGKPIFIIDKETGKLMPDYAKDEQGNIIYETVVDYRPAKPTLPADITGNLEKEIAIYSFSSDNKMHLKYYKGFDNTGESNLVKEIILKRSSDN